MRILALALSFISLASLAAKPAATKDSSCDFLFKKQKLCAQVEWAKPPAASEIPGPNDFNSFTMKFHKSATDSALVDPDAEVRVKLWMTEMDHGGPLVKVEKLSEGTYKASNVMFTMPGKWDVEVMLLKGPKTLDTATHKYTL